jgi:uncharacterized cysteine cluster protein YcgN (CxxCxxCC family)
MDERPFWKRKRLDEMTPAEWESLCDGCGKCCLMKLEYEDTGEIDWTNVACRLLDHSTCRCKSYALRQVLVEDCVSLTPDNVGTITWLPATCGYRLIREGRDLYWWHPLVSGDADTVHAAGISVRGRVVAEDAAGELEDHIVGWVDRRPGRSRQRQVAPKEALGIERKHRIEASRAGPYVWQGSTAGREGEHDVPGNRDQPDD